MTRLERDRDGYCYWHIAIHGRAELWRHMTDAQKVAATFLERIGWTLVRVDRDKLRQAYMTKPGEMDLVIGRPTL